MPHERMNTQQVAAYLHMDARELVKLAGRGKIPCHRSRGVLVFRKSDVDHWVEQQMGELSRDRLAGIEAGVSAYHGFDPHSPLVWPMVPRRGLAVPLKARTADAAIRRLVDLACDCDLVYDRPRLIEAVCRREKLHSTAVVPGVAMPHPRHPMPYDIAAGFVVAGVTASGIPFGAADGSLTRLLLLVCCKEDHTHLHVLARLGQMLHDRECVEELIAATDPRALGDALRRIELSVLTSP